MIFPVKTSLSKRHGIRVGSYMQYDVCRFCLKKQLVPILDLNLVPLAGGFFPHDATEKDFSGERFFPLRVYFCSNCFLVQLADVVDSNVMFSNYFYLSSAIPSFRKHFQSFADELKQLFPDWKNRHVIEIGCNDGVLLRPLKACGFQVTGVDPATNVVQPLIMEGLPIINDFFNRRIAQKALQLYGPADVVVSCNSFAHIDDMHDVMRGINLLLKKDGVLVIEVHYLGNLVRELQYDVIYHEHHNYYSLLALERFFAQYNMEIFRVKPISMYGGSMRFYVKRSGNRTYPVSLSVATLHKAEIKDGLHRAETYRRFSRRILQSRKELMTLLRQLKRKKKTIAGYGASGKATIISSFCGIDKTLLDYIVDDAPIKQGAYTPYNHLPIVSPDILHSSDRPDYCLLFAWAYEKEISKKHREFLKKGGKFIVPLPTFHVLS